MKQRYDYIDIAKGLTILFVVWAHIMLVGWSHKVIYAFHMPLFFFVSGMLFDKNKYTSFFLFFRKRAQRLLLPYLIYSFFSWILWAGFRYLRGDDVSNYWKPLLQIFIAQGSGEFIVYNSALWFIPCLFAVEIIYYIFSYTDRNWLTLLYCFVLACIGVIMSHIFGADYLFLLPWNLDAAFYALPFFGVANIIMRYSSHNAIMHYCKQNRAKVFFAFALLFAILCNMSLEYGECSMGSSSYGCDEWIFFERAFCGCFAVLLLCLWISSFNLSNRLLNGIKWCGRNSLDIMCLHIPIKGVAIILITRVLQPNIDVSSSWYYSFIAFVLTVVVMMPIIQFINKRIRL